MIIIITEYREFSCSNHFRFTAPYQQNSLAALTYVFADAVQSVESAGPVSGLGLSGAVGTAKGDWKVEHGLDAHRLVQLL